MTMIIETDSFEGTRMIDSLWRAASVDIENIRALTDLKLNGSIDGAEGRFVVSGQITGAVEADCSRCLEAFEMPIDIDVQAVYVSPELFSSESERELVSDDLDVDVILEGKLNTDDIIREQVLLELPVKVLCKTDCNGLCAICGADLNVNDCKCGSKEADPRWSALLDLK